MHVPFCNGGRNHAMARNHPLAEPYRHRLGRETGMVSGLFDPDREVVQLHLRSDVIERLMCQSEIPIGAVQRADGIEFTQYFADALRRLESLQDDGLVWIDRSGSSSLRTGGGCCVSLPCASTPTCSRTLRRTV